MPTITLYHAPGACSRVTMNALEEIGLAYEDKPINIYAGEQKAPRFLAVNPTGKVPALRIDSKVLTENAAILFSLHQMYPHARLLPDETDASNAGLQDLVWCSSTLHPMVRQIRMPTRYTDGDPDGIKAHGMKHFAAVAARIAARINDGRWWYGERWSIVDVYLYWICSTAAAGGVDLTGYPSILDHVKRVRARDSFVRALARERAAVQTAGITLPPGLSL
ncbi:MAG: glutathione S-transferase family protein [Steroidobacteraceae bacterium]